MIQLNPRSICLHLPHGETVPLLAKSVVHAYCEQKPLGIDMESWQLEEVAHALIHYLRVDLHRDTIAADDFFEALSTLVIVVGDHPAQKSEEPIQSANLYHMAQEPGCAFELAFFRAVQRATREFKAQRTRLIRFVGLRPCVKLLLGAKNWGKSCQRLSDEIVDFIRRQMIHGTNSTAIAFAVSQ